MDKDTIRKGTTSTGFEFEIDIRRLDDMELIDIMAEVDENALLLTKMCRMILGDEQKKRLYDHLRTDEAGFSRVPVDALTNEITEIFKLAEEAKNS
jgi:hypothetical protein